MYAGEFRGFAGTSFCVEQIVGMHSIARQKTEPSREEKY
jgi:hypothetical protein